MNFVKTIFTILIFLIIFPYNIIGLQDNIWIDTDIGIGKLTNDVDDGIALVMALNSSKVHIHGISLVGNTDYGCKVTMKLLQWYNRSGEEIPVFKGARTASDLGKESPAVAALAQVLKNEKLTIVVLGPATNISGLLLLYPELKKNILQIIWCAGRSRDAHFRPGSGKLSVCDCNFDHDPVAGQILISSGVHMVLTGYEAASSIYLSALDILPLKSSSFHGDQWMYRHLNNWVKIWEIFLSSDAGFIPFDAVTMGSFLYPKLVKTQIQIPVDILIQKNDTPFRLFNPSKNFLIVSQSLPSEYHVDYCSKSLPAMKTEILKLLLPPSKDLENSDSPIYLTGTNESKK